MKEKNEKQFHQEYYGWNKPRKYEINIIPIVIVMILFIFIVIGIIAGIEWIADCIKLKQQNNERTKNIV